MSKIRIKTSKNFNGTVTLPLDKSISQRAAILDIPMNSGIVGKDIDVTRSACKKALIEGEENLYLGNSGTGIRLLTGYLSGIGKKYVLKGDESLSNRPMSRISDPLNEFGAKITLYNGKPPIEIMPSELKNSFSYSLPIPSAQLKSSLLFAALNAKKKIEIIEPVLSRDHTERMFSFLGCGIEIDDCNNFRKITLDGSVPFEKKEIFVPGDFSSASFFIALAILSESSAVFIPNVGINPSRIAFIEILKKMNADIVLENIREKNNEQFADIKVCSSKLQGINVPKSLIPNLIDEIPLLSILSAFSVGQTSFEGLAELRFKESDRLKAIISLLKKIQAYFHLKNNNLTILGCGHDHVFSKGNFNSFNDHRIAMCAAILSSRCTQEVTINDITSVETSFPNFFENLANLGFTIET